MPIANWPRAKAARRTVSVLCRMYRSCRPFVDDGWGPPPERRPQVILGIRSAFPHRHNLDAPRGVCDGFHTRAFDHVEHACGRLRPVGRCVPVADVRGVKDNRAPPGTRISNSGQPRASGVRSRWTYRAKPTCGFANRPRQTNLWPAILGRQPRGSRRPCREMSL